MAPTKENGMGKSQGGSISIGANTPTGRPDESPVGPYTTDEHDDETAVAGQDPTRTKPGGSRTETKIARQSSLGSDNAGDEARRNAPGEDSPRRSTRVQQPAMPDELAKRPKGPAQP
jgi:hypothetical protein